MGCGLFFAVLCVLAQSPDNTSFQTPSGYRSEIDIGSDVVMVYGVGEDFAQRAESWRKQGYSVSMMTGISWGRYEAYYGPEESFKRDEVQTDRNGKLRMHGDSKTVGYNVPTDDYVKFLQQYVDPAVDAGIDALYLEEPEFWAQTGWSEAFKRQWQDYYGEPWMPPDSSVDAQYRASRLKYELYFRALRGVFSHAKERAASQGRRLECHVPTHSLLSYSQWRIVSPESHLIDIPELDGYIAQVWTGTARSQNTYRGVNKERTFETAYLEYGQMAGMVRATGKKVWYLADPVEDNPDRSWDDYRQNYERTVLASLLFPDVHRYEVMPWPDRIFEGRYPATDADIKSGARVGMPADYTVELLTVINALNDMKQDDVAFNCGSEGIGVIVSDTLMFQRAEPTPSDARLSHFYGLAMPLVKHGIPASIVQLENVAYPGALAPYKVLLLSYEGQKPLKPAYHEALAQWVKQGGALLYVGDDSDPFNAVREWWNDNGANKNTPRSRLLKLLGVTEKAGTAPEPVGDGYVRVVNASPVAFAERADGADEILRLVKELYELKGASLKVQNYLSVRRGPYIVASVMDESFSQEPLRFAGNFVDLLDSRLPVISEKVLRPGDRALLYDLDWHAADRIVAGSARIRDFKSEGGKFRFTARGPKGTRALVRMQFANNGQAKGVQFNIGLQPALAATQEWDPRSSTLLIGFDNVAGDVVVTVEARTGPQEGRHESSP